MALFFFDYTCGDFTVQNYGHVPRWWPLLAVFGHVLKLFKKLLILFFFVPDLATLF